MRRRIRHQPVIDPVTGEPADSGCPEHSAAWLAAAVRRAREDLGLPPQPCDFRSECP